ncbi:MAG: hypothetical protein ACRDL8_19055, partial [Solirubrobacteraceae bacterium]
ARGVTPKGAISMTPLAQHIYQQLRRRLRSKRPSITYAELANSLDYRFSTHPRSRRLFAALTEVSLACRERDLPCLPAIVWRSGVRRPSTGYYKIAHPRARTEAARLAAWQREHARVLHDATQFPTSL